MKMFLNLLLFVFGVSSLICVPKGQFTQQDKNAIVQIHNNLRSAIAKGQYVAQGITKPQATNMRKMLWSCEVENSSQEVANKCQFKHSGTKATGENLFQVMWPYNPLPPPIAGIGAYASNLWESEFQRYGFPSNNLTMELFNSGIGHATQMAWWSTNQIGCGAAQCTDSLYQKVLVICHYKQQGNVLRKNIYEAGATCSNCGKGFVCEKSSGLCVNDKK